MTRVAVLISGRGSNMEALLRAAAAGEIPRAEMAVVIANRADAPGLEVARALGVEALAIPSRGLPREAHEQALNEALRTRNISLICLAGYMRLLTSYFVGRWAGRMLNIHPSLLPAYPGLDTHARVLAAGEPEHGCTVHLVTETMDEGPILGQSRVPVLPGDTEEVLAARVLAAEHALYPATLRAFLLANSLASLVK